MQHLSYVLFIRQVAYFRVIAFQFVFQFYKRGVITDDSCGKQGSIDHGVLGKFCGIE